MALPGLNTEAILEIPHLTFHTSRMNFTNTVCCNAGIINKRVLMNFSILSFCFNYKV